MLVLSGMPKDRPALVDFCGEITKNICLMICGHVVLVRNLAIYNVIIMRNFLSCVLRN